MAEFHIIGEIVKEKSITGTINKGIGMGELPQATGLSEFPMAAYAVNGTDISAVGAAIAEKAGVKNPVWPEGFRSAVKGIPEPEKVYADGYANGYDKGFEDGAESVEIYQTRYGVMYTPIFSTGDFGFDVNTQPKNLLRYADKLEEATFLNWTQVAGGSNSDPVSNSTVKKVYFPKLKANNTYLTRDCHNLVECVVGSIGYPVTTLYFNAFSGCKQSDLTITVYTNATTLADVTTGAPWGATNATIIYRNSTTGEVITE